MKIAVCIKQVFGAHAKKLAVSSTKSMTGHTLGAAGAIEAVAAVQALMYQVVPPTANLDAPDPDIGLDLVAGAPRDVAVTAVLSNSFAFGGHNVVLALTRP